MRPCHTLLLGVLVLPMALASPPAGAGESGCHSLPEEFAEAAAYEPRTGAATVTAIERVDRARVTRAQARKISMLSPVLSAVTISGRIIRPLPGSSIWSLSNGSFAIFDSEPTADAMQIWTKDMGDGDLYVRACLCSGANPNVDDGCKFDDPGNPTNPGACRGPACCGVVEGLIEGASGAVHKF